MDKNTNLADFKWIVELIRALRPDLCDLFNTENGVNLEFARWLLTAGSSEYRGLSENEEFRKFFSTRLKFFELTPMEALVYIERPDAQKTFPLPAGRNGYLNWFYRYAVDEYGILDLLDEECLKIYKAINPDRQVPEKKHPIPNVDLPFGVNLIGYAYGQLGIGEDLRMSARAFQKAGVPFTIINVETGADFPQNDRSMAEFVCDSPIYKYNLFCLTAEDTARFYAEKGPDYFKGHFNIGYWPWELSRWPDKWRGITNIMDEVWVSSRYIYDSLAPVCRQPVLIMPLAVDTGEVSRLTRTDFNLPEKAYLFCFSFDLNSSIHRKNPHACLKAFQMAFPKKTDRHVGLVIKCHKPAREDKNWTLLKEAARADSRITIIEETLNRPDLLALYKNCDCYLSLHRAEGFGRGLAEALQLGLEVIATDYSGNVDFCRNPNADLVPARLVPVKEGQYPHGDGQVWAEPDIKQAAKLMAGRAARKRKPDGKITDLTLATAGERFKKRLEFLSNAASAPEVPDQESVSAEKARSLSRGCIDHALCWPDPAIGNPVILSGWLVAPDGYRILCGTADGKNLREPVSHYYNRSDISNMSDIFINRTRYGNGFIFVLEGFDPKAREIAIFIEKKGQLIKLFQKDITFFNNFREFIKGVFEIHIPGADLAKIYAMGIAPVMSKLANNRAFAWSWASIQKGMAGIIPETPKASVIIPVYGSINDLKDQIAAFARDEEFRREAELIYIIDDPAIIEDFRLQIMPYMRQMGVSGRFGALNSSQGFAGASNLGARLANADILIFMNSDVIPLHTGWLSCFTDYLKANQDAGIVGCRLLYPNGTIQHGGCDILWEPTTGIPICRHRHEEEAEERDPENAPCEMKAVTAACVAMRKGDFMNLGGFDPAYLVGGYEDIDLCFKISQTGKKVIYLPEIRMTHHCHKSFRHLPEGEWQGRLAIYNGALFGSRWGKIIS